MRVSAVGADGARSPKEGRGRGEHVWMRGKYPYACRSRVTLTHGVVYRYLSDGCG